METDEMKRQPYNEGAATNRLLSRQPTCSAFRSLDTSVRAVALSEDKAGTCDMMIECVDSVRLGRDGCIHIGLDWMARWMNGA